MGEAELVRSLSDLLPAGVVVVSATEEGQSSPLMEGEVEAVADASLSRQRSFALGRECARRALVDLGLRPCAILVGPHGEPLWPQGAVGSITHRGGLWAAAVAHRSSYRAIGIDVEVNRPLPDRVRNRIVPGGVPLPPSGSVHWDAVMFSAMESVFKAGNSSRGSSHGLLETKIALDPRQRTFQGKVDSPDAGPPRAIDGVFAADSDLILTAAVVPEDRA